MKPSATAAALQLSLFDDARLAVDQPPSTSFLHPRARRATVLRGQRVGYELRRMRRRSIGFVVSDEGLSVSAPRWVGVADIEAALQDKADWILRKLQEQQVRARRLHAARVAWGDGVHIPFLGAPVQVVLDPRATGAVLDPSGRPPALRVGLPSSAEAGQIRDAVQSWLQRQALRVFHERCREYAGRLNVTVRRLTLSSAATRWGSASADGSIRLHWRLVHFALPIVDYVVAHELAHLREMNHSPAFWEVVRSVVPDYEGARSTLRNEVLPVF